MSEVAGLRRAAEQKKWSIHVALHFETPESTDCERCHAQLECDSYAPLDIRDTRRASHTVVFIMKWQEGRAATPASLKEASVNNNDHGPTTNTEHEHQLPIWTPTDC